MKTLNVFALATELRLARDAYYNGTPTMTDAEFDAKENELRKADPHNSFFTKVGAPVSGKAWQKVAHEIPMGSLNKAQDNPQLASWAISVKIPQNSERDLLVMEKLDGISISLKYERGRLVSAITRGDGIVGEDILRNVKMMKGKPNIITAPLYRIHVRGEIICLKSDFEKHFKGESNPRNTASGTAKRQSNANACRFLSIRAFSLHSDELPEDRTMSELLENLGFETVPYTLATGGLKVADVERTYQDYVSNKRDKLDYEIDGLVVALNHLPSWRAAGEKNHRPAGSIAYKFPHDFTETTLRGIVWQVGNSGRVTPVAHFDPVLLAGARVSKASLHNVGNIERIVLESQKTVPFKYNQEDADGNFREVALPVPLAAITGSAVCKTFRKGDRIKVSRRNDVIPYVEALVSTDSSKDDLETPSECPCCQTLLEMDGEYLICPSTDCEAQTVGSLKRWIGKVGVLDWGGAVLQALCDEGHVTDIADLYKLDAKTLSAVEMSGRRVGSASVRMMDNLNAKKDLPLNVLVGSLGIPLMGRSMVKKLVDGGFDSLSRLAGASVDDLARVPGMGQTKAQSFYEGFQQQRQLIFKLMSVGITVKPLPKEVVGKLSGKTICMTGFRDGALHAAIEEAGGTIKSGVSKTLDFLVAKDPTSMSGKAKKARDNGVTILSVDEMRQLVV